MEGLKNEYRSWVERIGDLVNDVVKFMLSPVYGDSRITRATVAIACLSVPTVNWLVYCPDIPHRWLFNDLIADDTIEKISNHYDHEILLKKDGDRITMALSNVMACLHFSAYFVTEDRIITRLHSYIVDIDSVHADKYVFSKFSRVDIRDVLALLSKYDRIPELNFVSTKYFVDQYSLIAVQAQTFVPPLIVATVTDKMLPEISEASTVPVVDMEYVPIEDSEAVISSYRDHAEEVVFNVSINDQLNRPVLFVATSIELGCMNDSQSGLSWRNWSKDKTFKEIMDMIERSDSHKFDLVCYAGIGYGDSIRTIVKKHEWYVDFSRPIDFLKPVFVLGEISGYDHCIRGMTGHQDPCRRAIRDLYSSIVDEIRLFYLDHEYKYDRSDYDKESCDLVTKTDRIIPYWKKKIKGIDGLR